MSERKLVVLIGPGDCASREELLHLVKMMLAGQINLVIIGKGAFETVRKDIWKKAGVPFVEDLLQEGKLDPEQLSYINIDSDAEEEEIRRLKDRKPWLVHITSPNDTHCPLILEWAAVVAKTGGYVTVQKPLTSDVDEADNFPDEIDEDLIKHVFGFDHYASKVYPCFSGEMKKTLKNFVGNVEEIRMRFLEQYCVTPHRAYTLQNGISEDWGAHVFALLGIFADWATTPSIDTLESIELVDASRGRYPGAPIEGDTYFEVEGYVGNGIPFEVMAGKGVADASEKWVRIKGDKGTLFINFDTNMFMIEGDASFQPQPINKAHTETFLKALLLEGKDPADVPGILDLDSAIEIVYLINDLQHCALELFAYIPGAYVQGVGNTLGMIEYAQLGLPVPEAEIPVYKVEVE